LGIELYCSLHRESITAREKNNNLRIFLSTIIILFSLASLSLENVKAVSSTKFPVNKKSYNAGILTSNETGYKYSIPISIQSHNKTADRGTVINSVSFFL
jgi:hypothetical protein